MQADGRKRARAHCVAHFFPTGWIEHNPANSNGQKLLGLGPVAQFLQIGTPCAKQKTAGI
jgi:hypothetical protein